MLSQYCNNDVGRIKVRLFKILDVNQIGQNQFGSRSVDIHSCQLLFSHAYRHIRHPTAKLVQPALGYALAVMWGGEPTALDFYGILNAHFHHMDST